MTEVWRRRLRRLLREALLVAAVVVAVQLWQGRGLADGVAPPLAGELVTGEAASLESAIARAQGKPVVVAFWATWCGVCKAEAGNLEAIAADHPLVAVATSSGNAAEIAGYLAERGRSLPSMVDANGELAGRWGVRGLPTHFIIDGRGNIRFRLVGYTTTLGLRVRLWWAGLVV
jgi:thiol-disulfide isomerase/thioredoxin